MIYDEEAGYQVFVPKVRENAAGVSWQNGVKGEKIPISEFYVARAGDDTAETMNAALAEGKHLLLTPGIYELEEALAVTNPNMIVLGMGLATLKPVNGNACIETADVTGLIIAGILFDAGETESGQLLVVGDPVDASKEPVKTQEKTAAAGEKNDRTFITLSDLFFRVGGAETKQPAKAKCCVTIHSSNVVGDNFWVWRADHGDMVAWDRNTADTGIVVNGDNVTIYGLMVEHFQKYQTVWNGQNGRVYMYQSEIPYDVPDQAAWKSHDGAVDGYASFCVADEVEQFEAWGLGIYLYNRDTAVDLHSAMEIPDREGVKVHNICTVMLTGYPGMEHVINDSGEAVTAAGERQVICEYENGIQK